MKNKSKDLDQFYTNPKIAKLCLDLLKEEINLKNFNLCLEPSAGDGSFFNILPNEKIGLDLDPKASGILKKNFFDFIPPENRKILTIGNPPFGKRSSLAIDFFIHATKFSEVIAFIVPLQWRKWSVQSKIPSNWGLILDYSLPDDSFLFNGKPYDVRCSFQVWRKGSDPSLRLKEKPATEHPDFKMFLYNNTPEAMKFFDYEWDFAVPRQGYADYSRRETKKENCEKTTQWMFFKAKNKKIEKKLRNIDFKSLAMKNTSTPGWGKADLVELYQKQIK